MSTERGSLTVLGAALVGVALVIALLIAAVGQAAAGRVRADSAADAAALAAAPATFRSFGGSGSPWTEAQRAAESNGATLLGCVCPTDATYESRIVVVEVAVDVDILGLGSRRITGQAAAEFVPLQLFDR